VVLDRLAKDERESVAVTVPFRQRPAAFVALLQEQTLNVFARDPFCRQIVELFAYDQELGAGERGFPRSRAWPCRQTRRNHGPASQRLRELFAQQLFVLPLSEQCDRVAPASDFLPMTLALGVGIANAPNARVWNPLHNPVVFCAPGKTETSRLAVAPPRNSPRCPYGLFIGRGFISANLAVGSKSNPGTLFNEADLQLFWQALLNMFEHDRSASKGIMSVYGNHSFIFKHVGNSTNDEQKKRQAMLGCAPAHELFSLVTDRIVLKDEAKPPRSIADYKLPSIDDIKKNVPIARGVEVFTLSELAVTKEDVQPVLA
jgi:hypothetical protein